MQTIGLLMMTLQISLLILIILLIRKVFGEYLRPWVMKCLWGILAIRMLIPFQFPVRFSMDRYMGGKLGMWLEWLASVGNSSRIREIFLVIWLAGILLFGMLFGLKNLQFGQKLRRNREIYGKKDGVLVYFVDERIGSCLEGLFLPKIYISRLAEERFDWCRWIVSHEISHYHAMDNWYGFFRNICLVIYWYNPLVWYAAKCSVEDCELACDYRVLRDKDREEQVIYGKCLVAMAARKPTGFFENLATGNSLSNGSLKRRIHRIGKDQFCNHFFEGFLVTCMLLITIGCFADNYGKGMTVMDMVQKMPFVNTRMVSYSLQKPEYMEEQLAIMKSRKRLQYKDDLWIVSQNENQIAVLFPLWDSYERADYEKWADEIALDSKVVLKNGERKYCFEVTEDMLIDTEDVQDYRICIDPGKAGLDHVEGEYDVYFGGMYQYSGKAESKTEEYLVLYETPSFDSMYDKMQLLLQKNLCPVERVQ
ncbi:MAG: M56 family metallopeptidase [Lachnospiraceae bacterium]